MHKRGQQKDHADDIRIAQKLLHGLCSQAIRKSHFATLLIGQLRKEAGRTGVESRGAAAVHAPLFRTLLRFHPLDAAIGQVRTKARRPMRYSRAAMSTKTDRADRVERLAEHIREILQYRGQLQKDSSFVQAQRMDDDEHQENCAEYIVNSHTHSRSVAENPFALHASRCVRATKSLLRCIRKRS
jgi:hypothetical protein